MVLQYLKKHRGAILGYIAFLVGMAILLNAFLQWRIGQPGFITNNIPLFFAGAVPLFCILLIAYGIFGNPFLGTSIIFACAVLLTYADTIKVALRMEHVFPGDLEMFLHLDELAGMYNTEDALPQWFLCGALVAIGVIITLLLQKKKWRSDADEPNRQTRKQIRHRVVCRSAFVVGGLALLLLITWPLRSPQTGSIPVVGYTYIAWNQTMNYQSNGFVAAFISNLKVVGMEEPENYSEQAVASIVEKYQAKARIVNFLRTPLQDLGVDVVYVMNESFSDPDRFSDLYPWDGPSTELMPELHRIEREAAHGWLYSPRYGGGTANIEYEVLTGFSTYFTGWAYPYQSMLPGMERFPSTARLFQNAGYHTIGLHPYGATMYRRNTVYPIMGFDEFHGEDEFQNKAHDRSSTYISDASAYSEVEAYLEADAEGHFLTLVTMQNHPQYGKQFKDHTFRSDAYEETYSERRKIEDYMELIHSSDAATGIFIDWVSAREKPTAVVFWGDHLPGVYGRLLEEDPARAYETPYFIYANFDAPAKFGNGAGSAEEDLGEVSPNYVSSDLFDYLDAQKPPWYYLLDAVKAEAPIVTATYFDENGKPEGSAAMEEYNMIAYDMLKGEQYADDLGMFDIEESRTSAD
jgi:hypothetical protein